MRRAKLISLALVALAALGGVSSAAAAVRLDPSFGHDGLVLRPAKSGMHQGSPEAVAIEPDGGLILATNHALRRLDSTGQLDAGFGEGGIVTPPGVPGGELTIDAAAVDRQGRIVVVGTSKPPQPPGNPLPSFPVLLTGSGGDEPAHTSARILRYLPNGRLDATFGDGGIVETDFGLPTPEFEGVKIASNPVVESTGVAVDGSGRVVVTGAAAEGVTTGCFHDDYFIRISYASYVARLTQSGNLDTSFGGDGVFGGRSTSENPFEMEDAAHPVVTPGNGVVFLRGEGSCPRRAGGLGFVKLSPRGKVSGTSEPGWKHRVFDATTAPGGSIVVLQGPPKSARVDRYTVEKLRPDGSFDSSFGKGGRVVLRLPGESYASRIEVAPDGTVVVAGTEVPRQRRSESEGLWWSRSKVMLVGLTPGGAPDPRFGPHGILTTRIPHFYESEGLWIDASGRPTVTASYRPERHHPLGFAAVRFSAP